MKVTCRLYNGSDMLLGRVIALDTKKAKIYQKLARPSAQKWYLKVVYGIGKNVYDKNSVFKNEGTYTKLREAREALSAFMEK